MVKNLLLIFLFCSNWNLFAQLNIQVKTDTTDYLIGDFIKLQIIADYPKNYILNVPSFKDSLNKFEIINEEPAKYDTIENKVTFSKNFILAYYDSAEVYIPSFAFILTNINDTTKKYFNSDSLRLIIHSLEVKADQDIKDIKEPIKIPLDILEIVLWVLLALLVLTILFFLVKKFLKKEKQEIVKPQITLPPHVLALTKLDELEREKLWQNGKVKEYHSRITEIVREYFERRFSFPALELTSSEQIQYLKNYDEAKNIINTTESFFNNADLVKFAKFNPVPNLNEVMMIQAKEIINLTIPKEDSMKVEKMRRV
jgi:hypothetical protein